jgi:hypothetical protein
MRSTASFLPAGLGGEGERSSGWSLFAPGSRSKFCDERGVERCCSMVSFSLSRHGGVGSGGDGVAARFEPRWSLPTRCYYDELIHAKGNLALAIFCRHGGVSSTSFVEALLRSCYWSSTLPSHQVVHPRWFEGGQQRRIFTERGRSSTPSLFLDGDT